jgi:hypothetical protein
VASSIKLARLAPDRQAHVMGPLAAKVGNRGMARLALARSPVAAPAPDGLPAVDQAAAGVLAKLGLNDANIAGFRAGQIVLFNLAIQGSDDAIGVLQLKPGVVRGGIFSVKVAKDPRGAIRAFAAARDRVIEVARAVHVTEYDLIGAAVHNKGIEAMLSRQKFTRTTEVLPEYLGLGRDAECEIFTKRFPVPSGAGAAPVADAPARADQPAQEPEESEAEGRRRPPGDRSGPRGRRPSEARSLSGRGTTTPRGADLRAGKATVTEPSRSSPVAPAPEVAVSPRQPVAVASGSGSTARELAAELSDKVTFTRRMTTLTQLVHWGLEVWKIYDLVVLVAQAQSLAAETFTHGSPYWRATEEARLAADRAADVQRQYNALDLRSSMPSYETAPEDWDSEYTLFQIQSDFVWIENDLFNARSSLDGSIAELRSRREQLEDGMHERERALLLPPTSLPYADAYLFASTGRQVNDRIDEAIASYQDAEKAIEVQQLFARAAVKTLEMRLRSLGSGGRFGDIPDAELRRTPLAKFTMRR